MANTLQSVRVDLRWARGFLGLAIAMAGGVGGAVVGERVLPHVLPAAASDASTFCLAAFSALGALGCAAVTIRAIHRATLLSVIGGFVAAAIFVPGLALFAVLATQAEWRPVSIVVGSVAAAPIAAGMGALLGVLTWGPLVAWRRLHRNPSRIGQLRFGVGLGGWLVGAGLVGLALASTPLLASLAAAAITLGVLAVALVGSVWAEHLRWLSAVAADRVAGWTICEAAAVQIPLGLARWTPDPDRAGTPSRVLCRVVLSPRDGGATLEPRLKIPAELVAGV